MKNSSQPRKKWGEARKEFKPLVPDIQKYLEQEYSKKEIYYTLYEQKKIEMSYQSFCQLVRDMIGVKKRNTNKKRLHEQHKQNIQTVTQNYTTQNNVQQQIDSDGERRKPIILTSPQKPKKNMQEVLDRLREQDLLK